MLLFADGFDKYGAIANTSVKGWTIANQGAGSWTFQAAAGVNGGGALQIEQDDQPAVRRVRPAGSTLDYTRFGAWFKSGGNPGQADYLMKFIDTTLNQSQNILITTSGEIGMQTSQTAPGAAPTTSPLAGTITTGANLHDGNFHFIEIYLKSENGAGGRFKVKVNAVTVVDFTGDTTAGATAKMNPDLIELYSPDTSGIWDDIMVWDDEVGPGLSGELSGTRVILTTSPDGAGDSSTLTPSAGSNYQCVDDTPFHDSDATYVEGDTSAEKDLYAFAALPLTPVTIDCVVVNAVMRTQAGSNVTTKMKAKSGGTEVDPGVNDTFSNTGYVTFQGAFEEDPSTTAAWTESGVNSAQFGLEMVS